MFNRILGAVASIALLSMPLTIVNAQVKPVTVKWLETIPTAVTGVSWGVPWPRGAVQKGQSLVMTGADGKQMPLQSWPMAYWPDGSVKWTGLATVAGPDSAGPMQIAPGNPQLDTTIKVLDNGDSFQIDTGKLIAKLPKQGRYLVDSMAVDGREVARHGQLECILQTGPETDRLSVPPREQYFSNVTKVTIEQGGPVRAVVKFEGMHKSAMGSREWLPFVVRLYFFAGLEETKMVHTITFDGDQEKDFIRGLGLTFEVPFREEVQNRHVRFSNSNGGVWSEPVLLPAGGRGGGGVNQLDGQRLGSTPSELARWDAFKLVQPNAEGFSIIKRTNPKSSWIASAEGERASGLVFVGDVTGGLGAVVKNFWQSYPASLEVEGATTESATLHVWLWSPDAPGMDMRHYDIRGHGPVNGGSGSYEDYEKEFATPMGVARTSDLTLFPTASIPNRAETAKQAHVGAQPPLLVTTPEYLHSLGVFGVWSVQDRSTPFKTQVEDRFDSLIDYYQKAIAEHHWYGFWNFGDVRHQYDAQRHEWRYDVGGYAWDNTELGSVLWIWYSYVRTGRADIFRQAEAMTRHTSEVDVHHIGPYAGLGSRHNVSHWGDSAKEARVSQATHNRFHYYFTTDERMGDLIAAVADVDAIAAKLDPMRKAQPKTEEEAKYPGRIRVGPDWLAFVGNWMTAWERTGDVKWRNKIMAGVDSLYAMPYWMRTGRNLVVGYDPATGKLYQVNGQPGTYNLPTIQGGAEVAFELTELLGSEEWNKMWLQYCRLGSANAETLMRDKETQAEGADANLVGEQGGATSQGTPRLSAFAYYKIKQPAFADRAIRAIAGRGPVTQEKIPAGGESLNPVNEAAGVSTNEAAQTSLQMIEILEMCADRLPIEAQAPQNEGAFRGGRGRGG